MDMKTCIDQCRDCEQVCLETLAHCLREGGKQSDGTTINALLDCIRLCGSCADLMTRNSLIHARHCDLCAEACRRCAEVCEAIGGAEMTRCAEVCRACERCCRDMHSHC
jgi:hypothetical protein